MAPRIPKPTARGFDHLNSQSNGWEVLARELELAPLCMGLGTSRGIYGIATLDQVHLCVTILPANRCNDLLIYVFGVSLSFYRWDISGFHSSVLPHWAYLAPC